MCQTYFLWNCPSIKSWNLCHCTNIENDSDVLGIRYIKVIDFLSQRCPQNRILLTLWIYALFVNTGQWQVVVCLVLEGVVLMFLTSPHRNSHPHGSHYNPIMQQPALLTGHVALPSQQPLNVGVAHVMRQPSSSSSASKKSKQHQMSRWGVTHTRSINTGSQRNQTHHFISFHFLRFAFSLVPVQLL